MTQLQQGYDHDSPDTLRGLAYVTFQELATRIAHRNTGRYSDDPVADRIMVRIAADENLHMVFYRDILAAALELEPSATVCAIVDEVLAFQMPGAGIPGFVRKAAQIAKAGIYDIRVHRDEVLMPILRHWRIFELTNLDEAAEAARTRLAEHLARLERPPAVRGADGRLDRAADVDRRLISPGSADIPDRFWQVSTGTVWIRDRGDRDPRAEDRDVSWRHPPCICLELAPRPSRPTAGASLRDALRRAAMLRGDGRRRRGGVRSPSPRVSLGDRAGRGGDPRTDLGRVRGPPPSDRHGAECPGRLVRPVQAQPKS